ncbi:MAG: 2-dehydropantoate 2-reductase [Anaerolineae bacterium]|nr:2-dehydropantoate 2-reductase [Anaerolineae bacterium]
MTEPLLVVGTGAMACLLSARLAEAGVPVCMLGTWPEGLAALQQHGVRRADPDGARAFPLRATADPADCAGIRFALVLVKSWQTERAARQLAQCLPADGLALTLQNGLGNRETLARHLGDGRVALGVTTSGATLLGPGHVRPGGEGAISVGAHPRLEPLVARLRQAGFTVEVVPRTDELVWGKLVVNAAINPLTALLRVPNGELLAHPTARTLMGDLAGEAAAVAAALGVPLPYPDPAAIAEDVARRTAANRSSMLQDVERGAPTEIDAICGAIAQLGEQHDVPTPVNRALWLLIKAVVETC